MTDLQEGPAPEARAGMNPAGKLDRYAAVNDAWGGRTLPPLTGPEAIGAAKRLYRKWMGRAFTKLRGKWTVASGNRRNRLWAWTVNPARGWRDLVHHVSHYVHSRQHPNAPAHGLGHSFIEGEMIAHVIASGWLDGKLKREPKPKPDAKTIRHARARARLARWEARARRAGRAIAKLKRTVAYYERRAD